MKEKSTSVRVEIEEALLYICLNRPEKRNALNDDTLLSIEQAFSDIPPEVKCVIIYGKGDHFCAGLDLSELREHDAVSGVMHSRMWHRVIDKVQYAPAPVVAVLHGACLGGGLELASACHIRIAEQSTYYGLPEGQRGIFVGGGASVRVPRLIGIARMTDMMLTGRIYQAEEGMQVGLSQYLVKAGEGLAKAAELGKKIGANAPMTNFALTHILPRIVDAGQDAGLMMEAMAAAIAQDAPEAKRRLDDFLAGRAKKIERK